MAILEGAGLALVAVDGHQPRAGVAAHEAPLLARGEARAPEPAQRGVAQRLDDRLGGQLARAHPLPHAVAAPRAVGVEADMVGPERLRSSRPGHLQEPLGGGVPNLAVADPRRGRHVAAAHAGRAQDADPLGIRAGPQPRDQVLGAGQHAGNGVADPDGERRRDRLALLHHVEVVVERGDLVDLHLAQAHLVGQGADVLGPEAAELVLDQVQVLDQQVAPPRAVAQEAAHVREGGVVDLPALRLGRVAAPRSARGGSIQHGRAPGSAHLVVPRRRVGRHGFRHATTPRRDGTCGSRLVAGDRIPPKPSSSREPCPG